jgi:AraC family transcriptional regulator
LKFSLAHRLRLYEPFLAWTTSGEVDFQERENKGPWITHREEGLFLSHLRRCTYDVRWKAVTSEPFEAMYVFIELPILQRAPKEAFGAEAEKAKLRDVSAFTDELSVR